MNSAFTPRPSQRKILEYSGGKLGISAVPGSGKTHTLSALAARLLTSGRLGRNQEVLIVTLVNSAVENFATRIAGMIGSQGLVPQLGYRIRTLHGLAHDIVREDPPLVGLDKQFIILDETAAAVLVREAARTWARLHAELLDAYVRSDLSERQRHQTENHHWPELIEGIAASFIRSAKDRRLTPQVLQSALEQQAEPLLLARMGTEIYAEYQGALVYRGAVDFDDLIRFAADMLESSPELRAQLQHRWPFILEDEAQDSSRLQEHILAALSGPNGNWVRVGDPNQAIFETFTTADPALLRSFISAYEHAPMPESGRSQKSIIDLANFLTLWTMGAHPVWEVRDALSEPLIEPVQAGDPQSNPPDAPGGITIDTSRRSPDEEVSAVAKSLQAWLPGHADSTVAILSSTNDHAARVVRALQARGIAFRELLRSTSPTRTVADSLGHVLAYLAEPVNASKLAQAYRVWHRDMRGDQAPDAMTDVVAMLLRKLRRPESFVAPLRESEEFARLLAQLPRASLEQLDDDGRARVLEEFSAFQSQIQLWLRATILPIDQLTLTIAEGIFWSAPDLALAHKLALVLAQIAEENPHWRLPDLAPSLREIASNERRFVGFSADDSGFDPDLHKGEVIVSTIHKAKGLEWDRVYLMSVNDYDFPSAVPGDRFIAEKWFVRDGLNLEAETLAQLDALEPTGKSGVYREGIDTRRARIGYARERLRLLYVGITRARRDLIVTCNTGRSGEAVPAVALAALGLWTRTAHGADE